MVLLLAPTLDESLLGSQSLWLEMSDAILDEMLLHGNFQAAARKSELRQVHQIFSNLALIPARRQGPGANLGGQPESEQQNTASAMPSSTNPNHPLPDLGPPRPHNGFWDDAIWQQGFSADQLLMVADTLDLDGLDWMTTASSIPPDLSVENQ